MRTVADMIELTPLTQKAAKAWVAKTHRHLGYPPGDVCRVALTVDGEVVAAAVAGRPPRLLQDGRTLAITRVASAAHPDVNACSRLYGAIRRAALNLGWRRFVTYTLASESGESLRAAGFKFCGYSRGGEHDRPSRPRRKAEQPGPKGIWMWPCPQCGRGQCPCVIAEAAE